MKNLMDLDEEIENLSLSESKFDRRHKILNLRLLLLIANNLNEIDTSLKTFDLLSDQLLNEH